MWTLDATVLVGVTASALAMAVTRAHWTTESPSARAGPVKTRWQTALAFTLASMFRLGALEV
jgi:hypothetical protein